MRVLFCSIILDMRTVYFLRHGATEWNLSRVVMGQLDVPLSEQGREQARKAAEELADVHFDICYASPLSRAKETAEIVRAGNKAGFELVLDKRLIELYAGAVQGKPADDWAKYDDGSRESDMDILARAKHFSDNVLETAPDGSVILIVSHSGLLKNLRHALLCKEGDVDYGTWLGNCEYVKFEY